MTLLGTLTTDWAGYLPAQKVFYGIGYIAAFLIVILGFFQLIGMEIHADVEHPDHNGASLFSVKPIIGFFFGFGWAGGSCLEHIVATYGANLFAHAIQPMRTSPMGSV